MIIGLSTVTLLQNERLTHMTVVFAVTRTVVGTSSPRLRDFFFI